ncbi:DNA polymerase III subunit chi [Asticcacaulis machinosus]|uniref:DNA polymerase III subunit chi n=1 Tax=Asticcacaulis machinosus TaxID=2984211 RepID=A0ABT5HF44_9CAUL|nr:DNA polymerase III subunit chi [Asticcacaulis machinosus]MDC7674618.1 DNA polymerase III subunit chi [Asticcacaulis machinosus]
MTEIWFYHLETTALKAALPDLLEKTLQRGWRAYVLGQDDDLLEELNTHLWAYRDEAFLGHGLETAEFADRQPILLGKTGGRANNAQVLFSVTAGELPDLTAYQRCLIVFEGRDDAHIGWARAQWKQLKTQNFDMAYWKQNDLGRWEKMQ